MNKKVRSKVGVAVLSFAGIVGWVSDDQKDVSLGQTEPGPFALYLQEVQDRIEAMKGAQAAASSLIKDHAVASVRAQFPSPSSSSDRTLSSPAVPPSSDSLFEEQLRKATTHFSDANLNSVVTAYNDAYGLVMREGGKGTGERNGISREYLGMDWNDFTRRVDHINAQSQLEMKMKVDHTTNFDQGVSHLNHSALCQLMADIGVLQNRIQTRIDMYNHHREILSDDQGIQILEAERQKYFKLRDVAMTANNKSCGGLQLAIPAPY